MYLYASERLALAKESPLGVPSVWAMLSAAEIDSGLLVDFDCLEVVGFGPMLSSYIQVNTVISYSISYEHIHYLYPHLLSEDEVSAGVMAAIPFCDDLIFCDRQAQKTILQSTKPTSIWLPLYVLLEFVSRIT